MHQPVIFNDTLRACESAVIDGKFYTSSQTIIQTFPNAASNGCDSIRIIDLNIDFPVMKWDTVRACVSTVIDGVYYDSSQYINKVIFNGASNGCDSIHITNLIINHPVTSMDTLISCEMAAINGQTYDSSQVVIDTLFASASNGCDSIHTTNLIINSSIVTSANLTACGFAVINGNTYNNSQIVMDTMLRLNGCDSIHTTNLTITALVHDTITLSSCDSIVIFGKTFKSSTIAIDTLLGGSITGCDSIITANISIMKSVKKSISIATCNSAIIGGVLYTTSQQITNVFPAGAVNGCDSIQIIDLEINSSVTTQSTRVACGPTNINGTVYTTSQMVTDVFTGGSFNGCDSTHITDLTIDTFALINIEVSSCDSLQLFGNTYYSSQVVSDTLIGGSYQGCDSITVASLTITNSVIFNQQISSCKEAIINDNTYTTSQIVTDIFSGGSFNGCDSVVVTDLTIYPEFSMFIDTTIAFDSQIIIGDKVYDEGGVFVDTLITTSGCDSVITLDLEILINNLSSDVLEKVNIYPNPTKNKVIFESEDILENIRIIDSKGRLLVSYQLNSTNAVIHISDYADGLYFYEITTKNGVGRGKIIKQH